MRLSEKQIKDLYRDIEVNISAECARAHIGYSELAERIGMNKCTLYRKRKFPYTFKLDELVRIANVLNVSLFRLIGGTDAE